MLFCCIWCRCVQSHREYDFKQIAQIVDLNIKSTKHENACWHMFFNLSTKHNTTSIRSNVLYFWIIVCFSNAVSLHMMPLRAISQEVRFQPNCSNTLFNIKKNRTNENACWTTFFNLSAKHNEQYLHLSKCFWMILCFLNVVSLRMVPLRAISQQVRVQPNCSNDFYLI